MFLFYYFFSEYAILSLSALSISQPPLFPIFSAFPNFHHPLALRFPIC